MSNLVQTLSVFGALGVEGSLRYSDSLFSFALYENYTVAHWSVDSQVEQDAKTLFKTKAAKSPFLQDEPLAEARKIGCDFLINGTHCEALGAAYLLGLPALSLMSHSVWDAEKIAIQVQEIDEQGELNQSVHEVIHAASASHVLTHRGWLQEQLSSPLKKGTDLWSNRKILFPNLEFCVEVERQLEKLLMPAHLHQVRVRLEALNQYDEEWTSERMFAVLPDFSGESDSTMSGFSGSRTYHRSNSQEVECEWHMKLKKTFNWRIHFFVDFATRKFIVGYIGPHLPI